MSEEDKVESEKSSTKPPDWEDSHTAASLPKWWRPDKEPSPPPAKPSSPPAEAAPPPSATPPAEWEGSSTAKELPTWWRPEQGTADAHQAPTIPPVPPAMPPAPAPAAPPTPTAMRPPGMAPAPPPKAILTVMSGPDMGFRFRIKSSVIASMGRDIENEVVLDDPATSRHHAKIEFRDGTYVLIDLGSANGTLVNDQRVTERPLSDGDRIKVGQDEIVISIM
jgi:FHA domain